MVIEFKVWGNEGSWCAEATRNASVRVQADSIERISQAIVAALVYRFESDTPLGRPFFDYAQFKSEEISRFHVGAKGKTACVVLLKEVES